MPLIAKFPDTIWDGLSDNGTRDNLEVAMSPDGHDYNRITAEVIACQNYLLGGSIDNGDVQAVSGLSVVNGARRVETIEFVFDNVDINITDNGANGGTGSLLLIDSLPAGVKSILFYVGTVSPGFSDFEITRVGTNIAANATFEIGLGSGITGSSNSVLTGAEDDFVPGVNVTLTAGVGFPSFLYLPGTIYQFSGGSQIRLNVAMADAQISGNDALRLNGGGIRVTYIHHEF